jgi:hypothetical protein
MALVDELTPVVEVKLASLAAKSHVYVVACSHPGNGGGDVLAPSLTQLDHRKSNLLTHHHFVRQLTVVDFLDRRVAVARDDQLEVAQND